VTDVFGAIVVRGTRWSWYGLSRVSDLRALRCQLVATNVFDGDDLLPLSDRHVDVIVCPYPPETADYATLTKTERSSLRASLTDRFTAVLWAFDPRRTTGELAAGLRWPVWDTCPRMSPTSPSRRCVAAGRRCPPAAGRKTGPRVVGEDVLVADSGTGLFKATIMGIDADGTLALAVHAFIPAHA
jgi:hypothetical protein